ncbi:MAG: DUF6174 domain-containing protein, partial [Ilumatobacteraceae bacterium]
FDGYVEAGSGTPEGDADPAVVAALREAQDRWRSSEPASYSYVVEMRDGSEDRAAEACPSGSVRVVVMDGQVSEATDLSNGCHPDLAAVPSVDDVFERAVALAGATDFSYELEPGGDRLLRFDAYDRSVDVSAHVSRPSPNTSPAIVGWADVGAAADVARARWAADPEPAYRLAVEVFGGRRPGGPFVATVRDGQVVDFDTLGDPELVPPYEPSINWATVERLYETIDRMRGRGRVIAVFDASGRHPANLWFDPAVNGIDDELVISAELEPLPA